MFSCEATEGALVSSSFKSSFFFLSSASQLQNLSSGNGCMGRGVNCQEGRGVNFRGGGSIAKPEGRVSLGGTGSDSSSSILDMSEFVSPSICSPGNNGQERPVLL